MSVVSQLETEMRMNFLPCHVVAPTASWSASQRTTAVDQLGNAGATQLP